MIKYATQKLVAIKKIAIKSHLYNNSIKVMDATIIL